MAIRSPRPSIPPSARTADLSRGTSSARRCGLARQLCSVRVCVDLLGLLTLRCAAPGPAPPGDYDRHEGDGCGETRSECIDAESLWRCEERVWSFVDCSDECMDRGGAVGCLAGATAGDGARCWCASFMPECAPQETRCADDEQLLLCQADTLRFESERCEFLCGQLSPPHVSNGCHEGLLGGECRCTTEGTPCSPGSARHCGIGGLAACVDGLWTLKDCYDECGGTPGTCDPWAIEGAACGCTGT